jgi:hypothetical protein
MSPDCTGEMLNACRILVQKLEEKKPLECKSKNNINKHLPRYIGLE